MDSKALLNKVVEILEDSPTSVLATVDVEGRPHIRWMVPTVLMGSPGLIYAVTAPEAKKVDQIRETGQAEWLLQKRDLSEIVNLRGKTRILEHPSLMREVIERLGPKLKYFWKFNSELYDFMIIETEIEDGVYYNPLTGEREFVKLKED